MIHHVITWLRLCSDLGGSSVLFTRHESHMSEVQWRHTSADRARNPTRKATGNHLVIIP